MNSNKNGSFYGSYIFVLQTAHRDHVVKSPPSSQAR